MSLFWKSLAMLGGRSWAEMDGRPAADCDKSFNVGLMSLLSISIIFVGHWLFWQNVAHVAAWALEIAVGVALIFSLIYRAALRALETAGLFAKAVMLLMLAGVMGVNAMLAGHELPLLAFRPQVEAQAKLGAAQGVTAYGAAVATSLGLPQLRDTSTELDKAIGATITERARTPDSVQQLQQQASTCESEATRLHMRFPARDEPGYASAYSEWWEKRSRCKALAKQAAAALAEHQARTDKQLESLNQSRDRVRKSLEAANSQYENTLKRDSPTVTASATTGFARHAALWSAVAAGTIPAWAAYGLIFVVLVVDSFSFVYKVLARNDKAASDRIQAAAAEHLHEQVHAAMVGQQRSLIRKVVASLSDRAHQDLYRVAGDAVMASVVQDLEMRAFDHALRATKTEQGKMGAASMLARLKRVARSIRERAAGGPVAAAGAAG